MLQKPYKPSHRGGEIFGCFKKSLRDTITCIKQRVPWSYEQKMADTIFCSVVRCIFDLGSAKLSQIWRPVETPEFCKFNLNSSAQLSVILVSFTLRFDILVAPRQRFVWGFSNLFAFKAEARRPMCLITLRPVAMVLMLESFPHHPQSSHSLPYLNHWLRGLGTVLGNEQ